MDRKKITPTKCRIHSFTHARTHTHTKINAALDRTRQRAHVVSSRVVELCLTSRSRCETQRRQGKQRKVVCELFCGETESESKVLAILFKFACVVLQPEGGSMRGRSLLCSLKYGIKREHARIHACLRCFQKACKQVAFDFFLY